MVIAVFLVNKETDKTATFLVRNSIMNNATRLYLLAIIGGKLVKDEEDENRIMDAFDWNKNTGRKS